MDFQGPNEYVTYAMKTSQNLRNICIRAEKRQEAKRILMDVKEAMERVED